MTSQEDAAMRAGHYYVWLPGAEYDDLTARLARAERIEAAAREVISIRDGMRDAYGVPLGGGPVVTEYHLDRWVGLIDRLESILAEPVDDAGSGEEG